LRKLLRFSLGLVFLIVGSVLVLFQWPSLMINSKTLEWARFFAARQGVEIQWKSALVEVTSVSLFKKRFKFDFDGFCVTSGKEFNGCFDSLFFVLGIKLDHFLPKLIEAGPVQVLGGRVHVSFVSKTAAWDEQQEEKTPEGEPTRSLVKRLCELFCDAQVQPMLVEIDNWQVEYEGQRFRGVFRLNGGPAAHGSRWIMEATEKMRVSGRTLHHGNVRLIFENRSKEWDGVWSVIGDAKAWFRKKRFTIKVRGSFEQDRFDTKFKIIARNLLKDIPNITASNCELNLKRMNVETADGKLNLNCQVNFDVRPPPIKEIPALRLPTTTRVNLKAVLNTHFPPDPASIVSGLVELKLVPILHPLFEGRARLMALVSGVPGEFPRNWKVESDIGASLKIRRFDRVVELLAAGPWAVPAPLNVLRGEVEVGASGEMNLTSGKLPVFFKTRLSSVDQKLDLDGRGEIRFRSQQQVAATVDAMLILSDVQIALPRLSPEYPPRWIPDGRIHSLLHGDEHEQKFHYEFDIRTSQDSPVNILSNLAKTPVPIHLQLKLESGQPIAGTVRIMDFPLELFKRDARVERLNIQFKPTQDVADVDGSIRVNYADYIVNVLLFGTLQKPKLRFTSDPPVAEDQLLAVLLFGRPIEELDADQAQSLGSAHAALADSAVSLASLYFLASTPVESIGYDAQNGVFIAKLRLGAGTSMNVGAATSEFKRIGIRKRIGRYWTLTTDLEHPTDPEGRSVSAFLEWARRY
jgi:hypothetical protein